VVADRGTRVVLRRYLQYVLDRVIVFVAALVGAVLGGRAAISLLTVGAPPMLFIWLPVSGFVAAALVATVWVEVWAPLRCGGATPAMRWLGLRIQTLRGNPPSLGDLLLRSLLFTVDGLLLGLVGAVFIAFSPRHQRIGDIVARTVVVRVDLT
jgi:uncharacterized RDD family membrane protein YckC